MSSVPIEHIPVLSDSLVRQISLPRDAVVVDATIGHGGHSYLLGNKLGPEGIVIGFDVDQKSLDRAAEVLSKLECKVELVRANFAEMQSQLERLGIDSVDFVLADLGWCSAQVLDPDRGMSFQQNMRLDMRLDDRIERSAVDILKSEDENSLADIIYYYGEERASRRIAKLIVEQRKVHPITTTAQLSAIVCRAMGLPAQGRRGRIHPATKTFQALRIAVNKELEVLEQLLETVPKILKSGGLVGIISFHSLEDRIVKENFKANKVSKIYEIITKKPICATRDEAIANPRARSAKLRIARKVL